MEAKELRIIEIMEEMNCDHDVAEALFIDEICDECKTDDIDVAETIFYADADENAQMIF